MQVVYAGDSSDVIRRMKDHCSGNVEGSAFRRSVAGEMGFTIKRTKRTSGTWRKRIDLPNPDTGEAVVSSYIRSGLWSWVICYPYRDFQWYVIDQLKPPLNKDKKKYNPNNLSLYQELFDRLLQAPKLPCDQLVGQETGPGVYLFHHNELPSPAWREKISGDLGKLP